jgi:hypothetical protein
MASINKIVKQIRPGVKLLTQENNHEAITQKRPVWLVGI